MIINEIMHGFCCLFMWCVAFAFFCAGPVTALLIDPMTGGMCWCVAFVAWAAGLAFYDSHLRLRQNRIHENILRQYNAK